MTVFMACWWYEHLTYPRKVSNIRRTQNQNLKVDYVIICIICGTDLVNRLTLQMYTLHKYK